MDVGGIHGEARLGPPEGVRDAGNGEVDLGGGSFVKVGQGEGSANHPGPAQQAVQRGRLDVEHHSHAGSCTQAVASACLALLSHRLCRDCQIMIHDIKQTPNINVREVVRSSRLFRSYIKAFVNVQGRSGPPAGSVSIMVAGWCLMHQDCTEGQAACDNTARLPAAAHKPSQSLLHGGRCRSVWQLPWTRWQQLRPGG